LNQKKHIKTIKIKLFIPKSLSSKKDLMESTQLLELEYDNPVKVEQILKDSKIKDDYLGIILLNGEKNIDKEYLIQQSCELRLFLMMAGG